MPSMHRFRIEGMSCGHCVAAVTREILALDPDARVRIDLASGQAEIESGCEADRLIAAIAEAGYAAQPAPQA